MHTTAAVTSFLFAAPVLIVLVASLKSSTFLDFSWAPQDWTLRNYREVLGDPLFPRYVANSFLVGGVVTGLTVLVDLLAAYAFAKLRFVGRDKIFALLLATMMLPFSATLVPVYLIVAKLGMVDTYPGMVVPALAAPFGVFLLRQFIRGIPDSLLESARIDGASELRIFASVILPLCRQPMAVLAIFTFVGSWNSFLWPLLIAQSPEMRTLTVGIATTNTQFTQNIGGTTAVAVLSLLPMAVLFLAFQRYFIRGVLAGALKA
ncbi:carbohydrate ABC transporter permease [Kribbella sandramycini]|uniref:ABC-type glycerol-3-phosphate transport system permease component n=1 Tax=Kribbella sandramycini TaxID=60450 RepID=A0A7Y4P3Q6_9ACTN|nr:carbohydrate ABC transporter permease [Kribbella sandramycini]MBB6570458.1 ABC-type glycerol-3-phosphate transport system permease component [Kribbella sandramycini]NOL45318.1 carbohydrate ABC transporter permease [Kribbella sandramycini]